MRIRPPIRMSEVPFFNIEELVSKYSILSPHEILFPYLFSKRSHTKETRRQQRRYPTQTGLKGASSLMDSPEPDMPRKPVHAIVEFGARPGVLTQRIVSQIQSTKYQSRSSMRNKHDKDSWNHATEVLPVIICVDRKSMSSADLPSLCEFLQMDVTEEKSDIKFASLLQEAGIPILPYQPTRSSDVETAYLHGNVCHPNRGISNVICDMREMFFHNSFPSHASFEAVRATRSCFNVSRKYWMPSTVVCCSLWDSPEAREFWLQCQSRFRHVYYFVEGAKNQKNGSAIWLQLKGTINTNLYDDNRFSSQRLKVTDKEIALPGFGNGAALVCQYPNDAAAEAVDRKRTRQHPSHRVHYDTTKKRTHTAWFHDERLLPASHATSINVISSLNSGTLGEAHHSALKHRTKQRVLDLTEDYYSLLSTPMEKKN